MKKLIWIFVAAFCFRLILSFPVWHGDMENHMDWGIRFWEYGPSKFFAPETNVWSDTWPNQPPGTIYTFALTRKLFEGIFSVFWWINVNVSFFPSGVVSYFETNLYPALLKLPSILADLGIGYLIYKLTKRKIALVLWLFNPVVWYNSAVWGQTDALVNSFALLSFYLLLQRKLTYSLLAVTFSLFIKASLLIFVPIWVVVALRQKYKFSQYLIAIFYSLTAIVLLTLPFSQGNPLVWLYELYIKKVFVVQLHLLTANGFNLWAILTGIHERPDIYQYWGYFLFLVAYIPLLFKIYKKQDLKSIAWVLALSAFSSFMLLTNMHERYLYPLFPYLTILVALDFRLLAIYVIVSFIHLLNLYNFWWFPEITFIKNFLSFGNRLMPRILAVVNMVLYILTYKFFLRQMRQSRL
jgi:Gpi18-like mannosyltransferase